jgi:hypothetical protein
LERGQKEMKAKWLREFSFGEGNVYVNFLKKLKEDQEKKRARDRVTKMKRKKRQSQIFRKIFELGGKNG